MTPSLLFLFPRPVTSRDNLKTSKIIKSRTNNTVLLFCWRKFPYIIVPLSSEPGGLKKVGDWRLFFWFSMKQDADSIFPFESWNAHCWIIAFAETKSKKTLKDKSFFPAHVSIYCCSNCLGIPAIMLRVDSTYWKHIGFIAVRWISRIGKKSNDLQDILTRSDSVLAT